MSRRQAVVALVLVCLVWGVSFTGIKQALSYTTPLMLLGARFALATLMIAGGLRGLTRSEAAGGLVLGGLFWAGFVFQTTGLQYTTPSRSAFLTILSTPLVPVLQFVLHRTVPRAPTLAAIGLAVVGTWMLTSPGGGAGLNRGDLLTIGCAVVFTGQIVAVGHYAARIPIERLLVLELGVCAVLSLLSAPLLETPRLDPTPTYLGLIAFLAVTGVWSFRTQLRAQQVLTPTHTALVFTLEPVFAAITSFLVLGERLNAMQLAGASLILAAVAAPALERAEPADVASPSG
ncbi:MAG TPA: DMT family transporter [Gemmatimonadales bacterium]|nr:DMT family transporter [Gemmatimonadales bacterium]